MPRTQESPLIQLFAWMLHEERRRNALLEQQNEKLDEIRRALHTKADTSDVWLLREDVSRHRRSCSALERQLGQALDNWPYQGVA